MKIKRPLLFGLIILIGICIVGAVSICKRQTQITEITGVPQDTLTEIQLSMLNSPRKVHVVFDERYDGYSVEAMLYPDENCREIGMASFYFKNEHSEFRIDSPYYWFWYYSLDDLPAPDVLRYEGETYHVSRLVNVVQGNDCQFLEAAPFCFKDVDFDGEREICIMTANYKGYQYAIYKILGPDVVARMVAPPFNHIYYHREGCETLFDYQKKRIIVKERLSATERTIDTYVRRKRIENRLDPMAHKATKTFGLDNIDAWKDAGL